MKDLEVIVKYDQFNREYKSLLHLWNDYYLDYKNVDIPFLLVRFEDLVFHAEEVTTKVCECAGGKMSRKTFQYVVASAKKGIAAHGEVSERTGYVDALVRYGTLAKRYKGWESAEDLKYVKENIDPSIMKMMQYATIDPSWTSANSPESKEETEADDDTKDEADDDGAKDKADDDDAKDKADDDAKEEE